jgi:ribose 5-phosphate isomerase B
MTTFFVGSDHGGVMLKGRITEWLRELGHGVEDVGTFSTDSVDYPEIATAVADRVVAETGARGVLVCGTGIGMSMAANKVRGIRAALATDPFMARMAREHNDANLLCLGERVVGIGLAREILGAFLEARFEAGRHERRVGKIMAVEER